MSEQYEEQKSRTKIFHNVPAPRVAFIELEAAVKRISGCLNTLGNVSRSLR